MPQPTKPQLAIYAAFAIAVLLIGARFLRSGEGAEGAASGGGAPATVLGGVDGAADGSSADPAAGGAGSAASGASGAGGLDASGVGGAGATGGAGGDGAADGTAGSGAGASADALGGLDAGDAAAGGLVVDVKGAVRRPGVYRLPDGARALDAVRRAGGVTRRADRLGVNLAARIADGGEVVVPRRGTGGAGVSGVAGATGGAGASGAGQSDGAGTPAGPLVIDLNTASATELEQLDGVGPATAAKIVAYRDANGGIASIDELDEVSGIGEAKLAAIHAQLGR